MSYLSSTTSDHLHQGGGGGSVGGGGGGGGTSGLDYVGGPMLGVGTDDLLQIQQTATSTEINMFPNYLTAQNHVTNAQQHNQYGTELHNGLINSMSHHHPHHHHHLPSHHRNELPLRHQQQQLEFEDSHLLNRFEQEQQQLSSSSSYYYNNNEPHQPSHYQQQLTSNNTRNNQARLPQVPPRHHQSQIFPQNLIKKEPESQAQSSPASFLSSLFGGVTGAVTGAADKAKTVGRWRSDGGEGGQQYLGQEADYLERQRLVNDYNNYQSSRTAPPSPRKSSGLISSAQAQTQYRTQQQQQQHQHQAPSQLHNRYSNSAAHAPAAAHPASNYESNLRYSTDHFSTALNLNAHYPSGGGVGGGGPVDPTSGGVGGFGGFFGGGQRPGGSGAGAAGGVGGGGMGFMGGGGPAGEDEVRQQSASSESQAYYGNETMVKELRPEFVRWFYRYEQDRKWRSFTGYDSIRIESKYRDVFRDQIGSYSHSSYYPVASTNDESTDFSKFVYQQQMQNDGMMGGNPNQMGGVGPQGGGRFSDMMQQKWWPGKGPDTTCDTEFNNGGPGFPNQIRNHSVGNSLFGRMGNGGGGSQGQGIGMGPGGGGGGGGPVGVGGIRPDRALYKTNSASALLGSGGNNGIGPNHPIDINNVVVVREGLYEVDLGSWTCFSTYWPGDTCLITRGTWFYDGTWDPLPLEQAEKLEEAHMLKFCGAALINHQQHIPGQSHPDDPQNKTGSSANAPAVHRITFNEFHVDWKSPTDIFWYSQATSHKLMRSFGQKLGLSDWSHRICRGYYKPAQIQDRPSEISHIVFVIHGIGQKMDTGRIVRNCSAFRDCVQSMKDKYFPQLNNAKQRAEFFPVEWRSAAKLDNDVVEAITPQKLLSLRQLLNSTAMDIMYYTSPLYRAEIQNALIEELNRIYANFVKRNPNFVMNGGKVSVMAHSLGAVITYDILTGYLCGSVEDEIALMQQQQLHIPRRVIPHQQGLLFTLEHFFCLGSPLSVFLALRWREPHDATLRSQILPQHLCRRIYNVFYSSDPVAYRLEPLLNRNYVKIAPVTIHSYNAPNKPRYCDMPRERITIVSTKTASDNTNTTSTTTNNATSSLPANLNPFSDNTGTTTQKTTPTNKPNFPSLLPSPSKEANNWGGWFGSNVKKLWKNAPNPTSGVSLPNSMGGISLPNSMGGISLSNLGGGGPSLSNPLGGLSLPNPMSGISGALDPTGSSHNPHHHNQSGSGLGSLGGGLNNPVDHLGHPSVEEANFLAQSNKENYSTVVDEELRNIPNDLDYRLDFQLRESQFSGSSYLAALTSHTSYWSSPDAAYFVMTHLYDELIEQTTTFSGER